MQCQELLPEGQVFDDEVFAATECGNNPADEVSKQFNHGKNRNRSRVPQVVDFASARGFDDGQPAPRGR